MSTVGFDRVPQYDFLISADPFSRDASWAAMCKWMSTLSCGVSVSVNVTRLNADVNSVIRCLGILRFDTREGGASTRGTCVCGHVGRGRYPRD